MRFGSVSFFKAGIKAALFVVLPVCLVLLVSLCILYASSVRHFKRKISTLEEQLETLQMAGQDLTGEPEDGKAPSDQDLQNRTASKELGKTAAPLNIGGQNYDPEPVPGNDYTAGDQPVPTAADGRDTTENQAAASLFDGFLPHFRQPAPQSRPDEGRIAYLTFDDGPSPRTLEILEILEQYAVKATFFVVNQSKPELAGILGQIAAAGHTIGMHSATHDLNTIYTSVDAFLTDMEENYQFIYEQAGFYPRIFRFAGGSVNNYNRQTRDAIRAEMKARGFVYFDWNCATMDATRPLPDAAQIVENVLTTSRNRDRIIVLAHDSASKHATVEALPGIIEQLTERGYRFAALTAETEPIMFKP